MFIYSHHKFRLSSNKIEIDAKYWLFFLFA
jgi:hypothetical protein